MTSCNLKIWWNKCNLRQLWKRHSYPTLSCLCSQTLVESASCLLTFVGFGLLFCCCCWFGLKKNYPLFVQLRAFGKSSASLTFNLEKKCQRKVSGDKHSDETEDKWGNYSRKCINLKSGTKMACALHIVLFFLLLLLKPLRNPAETPVGFGADLPLPTQWRISTAPKEWRHLVSRPHLVT